MSINDSHDTALADLLVRKQPVVIPSAPKCPKCNKSVYKAEETRAANQIFHKLCFKCGLCNKLLEPNLVTEHQGDLFCKSCYGKKFGPKGYGFGGGAGTLSMDNGSHLNGNGNNKEQETNEVNNNTLNSGDNGGDSSPLSSLSTPSINSSINSPANLQKLEKKTSISATTFILGNTEKCGRCQKAVYMAEKVIAAGSSYHKLCFTCSSCRKMLNSMTCCDNSGGELFCKPCYGKQYGPKGVGFGIGAGTLNTN